MSGLGLAAVGGTTITASLADVQSSLSQAVDGTNSAGTDAFSAFAASYRSSNGGPLLSLLGINPFQLFATEAFHDLYWGAVTVFLGVMAVLAMQRAIFVRGTVTGRHPMAVMAHVYFRLLLGVVLISNIPFLYAVLMTINTSLSGAVNLMATQAASSLLTSQNIGSLTFASARDGAIRNATLRRAMALYPSSPSRDQMVQEALWYNATAASLNAALAAHSIAGQLPTLDPSNWSNASTPDSQVTSLIGHGVVQNLPQLVLDLGALPADSGPLSVSFPEGQSSSLPLLSAALASDDGQAATALAQASTPDNDASFESARLAYSHQVFDDTLQYVDTQILAALRQAPSLSQRLATWFSEEFEQAAASATGAVSRAKSLVDWLGREVGIVLTRTVAFVLTFGCRLLIEIELFVLALAVPFWLLPATEEAFYGVIRSLFNLSLAVPAYQFLMVFVDLLMGLVLKYITFGPGALNLSSPTAGAAASTTYLVTAGIAVLGTGGELIPLVMVCYLTAYVFLAVYIALKTPKLVEVFMKGAGASLAFLNSFATGLVSGSSVALATASAAGFGLSAGSSAGLPASASAGAGSASPAPSVVKYRKSVVGSRSLPKRAPVRAPSPAPESEEAPAEQSREKPTQAKAARYASAAAFGAKTFLHCLEADSPAAGFHLALKNLQAHRKAHEKEAEILHRKSQAKPRRSPGK